jgi:hypothetical protein
VGTAGCGGGGEHSSSMLRLLTSGGKQEHSTLHFTSCAHLQDNMCLRQLLTVV